MATKIEFPPTINNVLRDLEGQRAAAREELKIIINEIHQHLEAVFTANGGCDRCRGRGWVVVWDTLDYMDGSAAEYGPCPNTECTQETRKASGLSPKWDYKYDRIRGTKDVVSEMTGLLHGPLLESINDLDCQISALQYSTNHFSKGEKVVVTKGRKVPLGTQGVIAYLTGDGSALIKPESVWQDRKAEGTWVYLSNLEKLV